MIRRIAVLGSTGTLARPVVAELVAAGFEVSTPARREANVFDVDSLRRALTDQDAVYLNLSIGRNERRDDPHAETDGVRNVIAVARETGVKRLAMISSLLMNYQGMNGFYWWPFDVKHEAVRLLKTSGIPSTIFYPSSFMENFPSMIDGDRIVLAGKSLHPMWFIAGRDYGRQVARSFQMSGSETREYVAQGPEPFRYDEAARVFAANYPQARLRVDVLPVTEPGGIIEALDNYPETFQAEKTWAELGRPEITLAQFAKMA